MGANDAAHDWRKLYRDALFELDPVKLLERICEARNALLDQIADLSKSINREQYALRSALETLRILQELAERDLSERNKPVRLVGAAGGHMDIQTKYGWQELYAAALLETDWSINREENPISGERDKGEVE
jgi:hypothetical protein